jgi:peptidyl-prolyl cis-trans isomerase C
MRRLMNVLLVAASAATLAACGGGDDAPLNKGQVVATVGGKDITVHELNAELMGLALPAGPQRKQVEMQALQGLVSRTILADIAREQGIEKTPAYGLQKRRADEALLVKMLQNDIASKVPPPTKADADKFMADNPDLFAQRKIFTFDQIQFKAPADLAQLKSFEPLKTLEQVEQRLIEDGTEYRRGPAKVDTVGANPDMIRQIAKLPPGEVFIIPNGGVIVASRISNAQVVPFGGEEAGKYAMQLVQMKRISDATEKAVGEKIKKAREAVKYQKGFEPPKAPGAKPAAPAPAAG